MLEKRKSKNDGGNNINLKMSVWNKNITDFLLIKSDPFMFGKRNWWKKK